MVTYYTDSNGQIIMKDIDVMSKNENSIPYEEAIKKEFAINNAKLIMHKRYKLSKQDFNQLIERQLFLQKEIDRQRQ